MIWEILVIDLLRILTKEEDKADILKATSSELITQLKVPTQQSAESTEVLTQLAHTSRACQWAQNELKAIASSTANETATAHAALIKTAEAACAAELRYTNVGSIVGANFKPGDDNTAFLDYLTGIESTKHMFKQLITGENQQRTPCSPSTRRQT